MKSELKTKLRIGRICYTNCIPFFHNLAGEGCKEEYYEGFPAQVNEAMRRGKIDIAPISSLEYLNRQRHYYLLPNIAIGARDFSGSVLLLSKEKIEWLNHASIALPQESLSSSALLRILLAFKYKLENDFVTTPSNPCQMLATHDAALLIGDSALFFESEMFVYKYDLSEIWWNWAENPFCFAVWAVRRKFAEAHPEEVVRFYQRLRLNLDRNLLDIQRLVRDALGIDFLNERFSSVFGYLFNLSYSLDPTMQEGLELFYRLAYRLKISPRPKKLEFFPME